MTYSVKLAILGVELSFECETEAIRSAVRQIYPVAGPNEHKSGIEIILNQSKDVSRALFCPPIFEVDALKIVGRSGTTNFVADREKMRGEATLCETMLLNPYLFRHQVINTMAYYLLTHEHFTAIHAACFQNEKTTFVCLGPSGAGKSTISLAAMLRGYSVLSEDICFITGKPNHAIRTDCREIHILATTLELLPKTPKSKLQQSHNGKSKYLFPIASGYQNEVEQEIRVLFIEPDHTQPLSTFCEYTKNDIYDDLYHPLEEGFNLASQSRKENVDWLRELPTYRVKIGNSLTHFFELTEQIV